MKNTKKPTQRTLAHISRNSQLGLIDGTTVKLRTHVCESKEKLHKSVKRTLGYLPTDCDELFMGVAHKHSHVGDFHLMRVVFWVQRDSSPAKVAHEALHAVMYAMGMMNLDPNDYELRRPKADDPDYGFIPAEVAATMMENIVDDIMKHQATYRVLKFAETERRKNAHLHSESE